MSSRWRGVSLVGISTSSETRWSPRRLEFTCGTLATEFEDFAALGAGRNPQLQLAVDGFDGNFGAEGRLHHGDFGVGENVLIMPFETARFNPNMDVEVAFALG
jgi:hypothetical protein